MFGKGRAADTGGQWLFRNHDPAVIPALSKKPAIEANKRFSLIDLADGFYAYRAFDPLAHIANLTTYVAGPETTGAAKFTRNLTALRAFQVAVH